MIFILLECRETRRERILENRKKTIKIAEKQAKILARRKEEETMNRRMNSSENNCLIAEKAFFLSLEKTKKHRENKMMIYNEFCKGYQPQLGIEQK